jgi:hypothetical protein
VSVLRHARPAALRRDELRLGELLAEGGEGKVFALPLQPHLVYKEYQRPTNREHLGDLVSWPEGGDPELAARVRACASWPTALVEDLSDRGFGPGPVPLASGVVMPRAPRRFALRHRDGTTHLASLSYLTADPAYRAVAYGIELPPALSPERLSLVYALARLLESFEKLEPAVGHGDLSAKNVLWSLQRGPEIFVIDCDNCERFGPGGAPLSGKGRRRAMTPNWDDPAVPPGRNPGPEADRYSLALIFLRVAGAANFPVQARQRQGQSITVDFPVPQGYASEVLLAPAAPLWDLCARGLSLADPAGRPPASAWVAELEAVLDSVGARGLTRAVWATQGGGPASEHRALASAGEADVAIRPVVAPARPSPPRRLVPATVLSPKADHYGARPTALAPGAAPRGNVQPPGTEPATRQLLAGITVVFRWWLEAHRALVRSLAGRGTARSRAKQLARCLAVDVAGAAVALFIAAMAVAPILGI